MRLNRHVLIQIVRRKDRVPEHGCLGEIQRDQPSHPFVRVADNPSAISRESRPTIIASAPRAN